MLHLDLWVQSYTELFRMAIFNGHLITSTFFVISGFLLAYIFLNEVSKEKNFRVAYIFAVFIYRCLRSEFSNLMKQTERTRPLLKLVTLILNRLFCGINDHHKNFHYRIQNNDPWRSFVREILSPLKH